jgi:hypothetical protein
MQILDFSVVLIKSKVVVVTTFSRTKGLVFFSVRGLGNFGKTAEHNKDDLLRTQAAICGGALKSSLFGGRKGYFRRTLPTLERSR